MVDHMVDISRPRGRVDIQVGAGRRRRWSAEAKGRIVAESYAPGAVVSEVARRHAISPQHLFAWRKAAARASAPSCATITIEIAGAIVRATAGVDPAWLGDVLRAVKAAA